MSMKLSILMPAYNEEKTIHLILDKVLAVDLDGGFEKEIIIVDDYSSDQTVEAINGYINTHQEVEIRLYLHEKNQGNRCIDHKKIVIENIFLFILLSKSSREGTPDND